jgi:hypothetical protein
MKFLYQHPIFTSVLITAILLPVVAVSGGIGHGSYAFAIVLFPYSALAVVVLDHFFNSTIPMILIATLQLPLYGILISLSRGKVNGITVAIALVALHAFAALTALLIVYH